MKKEFWYENGFYGSNDKTIFNEKEVNKMQIAQFLHGNWDRIFSKPKINSINTPTPVMVFSKTDNKDKILFVKNNLLFSFPEKKYESFNNEKFIHDFQNLYPFDEYGIDLKKDIFLNGGYYQKLLGNYLILREPSYDSRIIQFLFVFKNSISLIVVLERTKAPTIVYIKFKNKPIKDFFVSKNSDFIFDSLIEGQDFEKKEPLFFARDKSGNYFRINKFNEEIDNFTLESIEIDNKKWTKTIKCLGGENSISSSTIYIPNDSKHSYFDGYSVCNIFKNQFNLISSNNFYIVKSTYSLKYGWKNEYLNTNFFNDFNDYNYEYSSIFKREVISSKNMGSTIFLKSIEKWKYDTSINFSKIFFSYNSKNQLNKILHQNKILNLDKNSGLLELKKIEKNTNFSYAWEENEKFLLTNQIAPIIKNKYEIENSNINEISYEYEYINNVYKLKSMNHKISDNLISKNNIILERNSYGQNTLIQKSNLLLNCIFKVFGIDGFEHEAFLNFYNVSINDKKDKNIAWLIATQYSKKNIYTSSNFIENDYLKISEAILTSKPLLHENAFICFKNSEIIIKSNVLIETNKNYILKFIFQFDDNDQGLDQCFFISQVHISGSQILKDSRKISLDFLFAKENKNKQRIILDSFYFYEENVTFNEQIFFNKKIKFIFNSSNVVTKVINYWNTNLNNFIFDLELIKEIRFSAEKKYFFYKIKRSGKIVKICVPNYPDNKKQKFASQITLINEKNALILSSKKNELEFDKTETNWAIVFNWLDNFSIFFKLNEQTLFLINQNGKTTLFKNDENVFESSTNTYLLESFLIVFNNQLFLFLSGSLVYTFSDTNSLICSFFQYDIPDSENGISNFIIMKDFNLQKLFFDNIGNPLQIQKLQIDVKNNLNTIVANEIIYQRQKKSKINIFLTNEIKLSFKDLKEKEFFNFIDNILVFNNNIASGRLIDFYKNIQKYYYLENKEDILNPYIKKTYDIKNNYKTKNLQGLLGQISVIKEEIIDNDQNIKALFKETGEASAFFTNNYLRPYKITSDKKNNIIENNEFRNIFSNIFSSLNNITYTMNKKFSNLSLTSWSDDLIKSEIIENIGNFFNKDNQIYSRFYINRYNNIFVQEYSSNMFDIQINDEFCRGVISASKINNISKINKNIFYSYNEFDESGKILSSGKIKSLKNDIEFNEIIKIINGNDFFKLFNKTPYIEYSYYEEKEKNINVLQKVIIKNEVINFTKEYEYNLISATTKSRILKYAYDDLKDNFIVEEIAQENEITIEKITFQGKQIIINYDYNSNGDLKSILIKNNKKSFFILNNIVRNFENKILSYQSQINEKQVCRNFEYDFNKLLVNKKTYIGDQLFIEENLDYGLKDKISHFNNFNIKNYKLKSKDFSKNHIYDYNSQNQLSSFENSKDKYNFNYNSDLSLKKIFNNNKNECFLYKNGIICSIENQKEKLTFFNDQVDVNKITNNKQDIYTFTFDEKNRINQISNKNDEKIFYEYDESGNRIFKKNNNKKEYFIYDEETKKIKIYYNPLKNKLIYYFYFYNKVLAEYHFFEEKIIYPIYDINNSKLCIIDYEGNNSDFINYDIFGNLDNNNLNDFDILYNGYEYDKDINGYWLKNRIYFPSYKMFLQRDKTSYSNGSNLFIYANNNPVNFMDLDGNKPFWKFWSQSITTRDQYIKKYKFKYITERGLYGIELKDFNKKFGEKFIEDRLYGTRSNVHYNSKIIADSRIFKPQNFSLSPESIEFLGNAEQGNMFTGILDLKNRKIFVHPTYPRENDETTLYRGNYSNNALFNKPISRDEVPNIDKSDYIYTHQRPIHSFFQNALIKENYVKNPENHLEAFFGFSIIINDPNSPYVLKKDGKVLSSLNLISNSINSSNNLLNTSFVWTSSEGRDYVLLRDDDILAATYFKLPANSINNNVSVSPGRIQNDFIPQKLAKSISQSIVNELKRNNINHLDGIINNFEEDFFYPDEED